MPYHRCLLLAALALLVAAPSFAQPAVGYAAPDDLDALLAYRLPDWGWNEWHGTADMEGSVSDRDGLDAANHSLDLTTRAAWFREGEDLDWQFRLNSGVGLQVESQDREVVDSDGRSLDTVQQLSSRTRRYLAGSPVFLSGAASLDWRYSERRRDTSEDEQQWSRIGRNLRLTADAGVGIGRLRNVTPLITAQRVSERLVALGRPALTRDQVLAVAEAIVRKPAYLENYERPDRHFWEAVLAPVLDPARPLSPYEVIYLQDVEREAMVMRHEGLRAQIGVRWWQQRVSEDNSGEFSSSSTGVEQRHEWALTAEAIWSRNLSLVTQVQVAATASQGWWDRHGPDYQARTASVEAAYLRDVADRHQLRVSLVWSGEHRELGDMEPSSTGRVSLDIADLIWVEDTFAIRPHASFTYDETIGPWRSWQYGVDMVYYFDSALF